MKEHPILFSAPMIRALLADRKHVTRRLSPQWLKVKAGDRLWVRETWGETCDEYGIELIAYRADNGYLIHGATGERHLGTWRDETFPGVAGSFCAPERWRPSIHMPRWASRILLECEEDARLERLQDITNAEAISEGCHDYWKQGHATPSSRFVELWRTLHTKPGERWEDNPEVVRVGRFRRIA